MTETSRTSIGEERIWPKWMRDVVQLLPVRSQFVLSGNTRDSVAFTTNGSLKLAPLNTTIRHLLNKLGYQCVLLWDPLDGLQILAGEDDHGERVASLLGMPTESLASIGVEQLGEVIRRVASPPNGINLTVGLILDFSSRLADEGRFMPPVKELYLAAEKAASDAATFIHDDAGRDIGLFNPVFWITTRPADVPFWFPVDNHRVHSLSIPRPNLDTRIEVLNRLASRTFPAFDDEQQRDFANRGALLTHDMTVNALRDVMLLVEDMGLASEDFDEAIESYRVGDLRLDNPWRSESLRDQISQGFNEIKRVIKGQDHAIKQAISVLKRTWLGLTGAQAATAGSRPRGILFFVGPTGVGKTQLAKEITRLVFGDEAAYKRFDMSEFGSEHSDARLLGAPPGYVGFDQGGELTNALRENPFRVLLFDEIEKAHDRILDKFLQVLEDGRLTDGSGQTVFFSDALIIFTSNKGVFDKRDDGTMDYLVSPDDEREDYERKVMEGVRNYFYVTLGRPELYNRVGENFVVFNFIGEDVADQILARMLENVKARLLDERNLVLELSNEARSSLAGICSRDLLSGGGRGVGSKLEQALVNPLAEYVFDTGTMSGSVVHVKQVVVKDSIYGLECESRSQ